VLINGVQGLSRTAWIEVINEKSVLDSSFCHAPIELDAFMQDRLTNNAVFFSMPWCRFSQLRKTRVEKQNLRFSEVPTLSANGAGRIRLPALLLNQPFPLAVASR
jgi:hypothetical protein